MVRHAIGIAGNGHPGGNPNTLRLLSPGFTGSLNPAAFYSPNIPTGLSPGSEGWAEIHYDVDSDTVGVPFVKDRVVTATSGFKGRVLKDNGAGVLTVEIIPENNVLVVGSLEHGKAVRVGDVLTDNTNQMNGGTNKSAVVRMFKAGSNPFGLSPGTPAADYSREGIVRVDQSGDFASTPTSWLHNLLDPVLSNPWPNDLSYAVYWDRACQLANKITVTGVTGSAMAKFVVITASGASTGKALAITQGTTFAIVDVNGTFAPGATISWTNPNATTGSATQSGALQTFTAGNLVPYCVVPNLQGVGSGFLVPPNGDSADGAMGSFVGPMPYVARNAVAKWGAETRLWKCDSASMFGSTLGGIAFGVLPLTAAPTPANWVKGETITASGGWSARVELVEGTPNNRIWVSNVVGSIAASTVVTGQTSGQTATAADNVLGWMPGAKYWNSAIRDDINAMRAYGAISARVATTGNIALSGTQTIDGVVLSVADVVLVKNQTNAAQNGVWIVASGAWTRHTSADSAGELQAGAQTYVTAGAVNANTCWIQTVTSVVLDTTSLVWAAAFNWEFWAAMAWEGDIAAPAACFTFLNGATAVTQIAERCKNWCAALRTQLGTPGMPVLWFVHDLRSQAVAYPGAAGLWRLCAFELAKLDSKVKLFLADDLDLYPAAPQVGAAGITTAVVHMQPASAIRLGRERLWSAYQEASITTPPGNFRKVPVFPMFGQSQLVNVESTYAHFASEQNPDLAKLPQAALAGFPAESYLDGHIHMWNFQTRTWETYSVLTNASGFASSGSGHWGLEDSFLLRQLDRYGEVWCFKAALGTTSCDGDSPFQIGTFDVDPVIRTTITATVTITAVTGGAVIVGPAGTFSQLRKDDKLEVQGSTGYLGSGGNNTLPFTPVVITFVSSDGAQINVAGAFATETSVSRTFVRGPIALKDEIELHWRLCVTQMVEVYQRLPFVPAKIYYQAEGNLGGVEDTSLAIPGRYAAKVARVLDWIDRMVQPQVEGVSDVPATAILKLSDHSPLGTPASRALIRAQTDTLVSRPKTVVIDTTDLPVMPSTNVDHFPRHTDGADPNLDYGVHLSPWSNIQLGFMVDDGLDRWLAPRVA